MGWVFFYLYGKAQFKQYLIKKNGLGNSEQCVQCLQFLLFKQWVILRILRLQRLRENYKINKVNVFVI